MVNRFADQMPRPIIGVAHSMGCAQMHVLPVCPMLDSLIDRQSQPVHLPSSIVLSLSVDRTRDPEQTSPREELRIHVNISQGPVSYLFRFNISLFSMFRGPETFSVS